MSGVNNNGSHSANGITALFIATGQDVANVAESSAAFAYAELLENGDYYYSITIPSLIVATYGGGTGLATQRECLELLGCYGKGGVMKFAEIVAATVLCGELSLGSAIVAEEWVRAHDLFGRNRPCSAPSPDLTAVRGPARRLRVRRVEQRAVDGDRVQLEVAPAARAGRESAVQVAGERDDLAVRATRLGRFRAHRTTSGSAHRDRRRR